MMMASVLAHLGAVLGEEVLYGVVFVAVFLSLVLPYALGAALALRVMCRHVGWRFWEASGGRMIAGGLIFLATPSVAQVLHG